MCAGDPNDAPDLLLRQLFVDTIGVDTPTAAVFRCYPQGLILPTALWLKAHTRILSKDVTTPDGWTVTIALESNSKRVTVTHMRKEQVRSSMIVLRADRGRLCSR